MTATPRLSLVIPTLNEAESLPELVPRIERVLARVPHEVIIADDASPDGTAEVAERLRSLSPALRVLRRDGPPGLSAAVLDGFRLARGQALGVMDADLQHDETILPALLDALRSHEVVLGSRYAFDGGTAGWSLLREAQSRLAARLTRHVLNLKVHDPLSGYFLLRRGTYQSIASSLRPRGWKILLEILAHIDSARVAEVAYTFRPRRHGRTKMSRRVIASWLRQLCTLRGERQARQAAGRILPRPIFTLEKVGP